MYQDETYEILPLEREEKEEFAENYFIQIDEEERIGPFLNILGEREYDSMSENPMLLSILCALASDEDVEELPTRKSELYKRIIAKMNMWYEHKGGEGLSYEERQKLEDFALGLFDRKRPKTLFEREDIDGKILDKSTKIGFLYKWDELKYSFLHSTLLEYFTARSLRRVNWKEKIREKKEDKD